MEDRAIRVLLVAFVVYSITMTSFSVALLFLPHAEPLSIQHKPVGQTIVGSLVNIEATVKGCAADCNVTLRYKTRSSSEWKLAEMRPMVRGGEAYAREIFGEETTETIDYQICVQDQSEIRLCSQVYSMLVADFYFVAYLTPVFYANRTSSMDVEIQSVGGFNKTVDLQIWGLPQRVTATFEPSHLTPLPSQRIVAKLHFGIQDSAPGGEYDLTVSGTSGKIKRSFVLTLSIPDFELAVNPSNQTVSQGDRASFDVTLRSTQEFDSDVRISVQGLPKGASYQLMPSEVRLNGIAVVLLSVETRLAVGGHTYVVTVSATGGGRLKQVTILLTIE